VCFSRLRVNWMAKKREPWKHRRRGHVQKRGVEGGDEGEMKRLQNKEVSKGGGLLKSRAKKTPYSLSEIGNVR